MSPPVRFPEAPRRPGLGLGLDLAWGGPVGFVFDPGAAGRCERLAPRVATFLRGADARDAAHLFFSWQPKGRGRLRLDDYAPAWDDLWAQAPAGAARALHHTALNLGAPPGAERRELFAFTNALCERYRLGWINEDLGLWSLGGKPLAYPLPPYLTDDGLDAAVANVRACQAGLAAPLVVEFPGFDAGVSVVVGDWHAYDYFRALAERTGCAVTLDVGHLLSWQWLRGRRGAALVDEQELSRLPLWHCFEIHLSGCLVDGERFVDAHHGVLLREQLELLELLLERCPNLRAVTYEDPRLDADGALAGECRKSLDALRARVDAWTGTRAAA